MGKKFLKLKVGTELFHALMSKPSFRQNWKAVSPAFYFLNRVAALSDRRGGKAVGCVSDTISDIFKPYTGGAYAPMLNDMEALGILWVDHDFDYAGKPGGKVKPGEKGRCKQYKVTDYGHRLIHSSNMEYLKALSSNLGLRRQNSRSISRRKVMAKTYADHVLDAVYDGLKHLSYDEQQAERAIEKSAWSDVQKRTVSAVLRAIKTKTFNELEYNEADGRVHHEVVRMKADARFLLRYNGMPYRACVDIRCCHPTFFSAFIMCVNHPTPTASSSSPSSPSLLPYSPHSVPDKGDNANAALAGEHQKWLAVFCGEEDPKEKVRLACGFPDAETAKAAMNQTLNGSKRFPRYLDWLRGEFPTLFDVWQKTDVKHTGTGIAKHFEHPLILHRELYERAEALGLKVMPEHDGFGIFADCEGPELDAKADSLSAYLRSLSVHWFGVPIVLKTKHVFDWSSADTLSEMAHKKEQLLRECGKLRPLVDQAQKRYFASGKDLEAGRVYWELEEKLANLLSRYRDVIEYWTGPERKGSS